MGEPLLREDESCLDLQSVRVSGFQPVGKILGEAMLALGCFSLIGHMLANIGHLEWFVNQIV